MVNYFADTASTDAGGNALNQYEKIEFPGSASIEPIHDYDGNMTSGPVPGVNGLNPGVPVPANATLVWDAENRLITAIVDSTTVNYRYDAQSRLISRSVGVSPTSSTLYIYDGWNRIAEYEKDSSGHELKRTYLWGMDLSGSMQGAGGVGGLLSMTVHDTTAATFYPTYDGNGNVSEYINENGAKVAHFEYDPFGNLTVDSENNAAAFPYRFSTKPQDLTTGLYYYGYRYYDPVTGRWPSRDPIEEQGGINLYGFVGNDVINQYSSGHLRLRDTHQYLASYKRIYLYQGSGRAWCNESTVTVEIHVDEHCAGDCVKRHELQHVKDIRGCCGRYARCVSKHGLASCRRYWAEWISDNVDWFECRAYRVETRCLRRVILKERPPQPCCFTLVRELRFAEQQRDDHCASSNRRRTRCPFTIFGNIR